jgi:lipid A 3-O-deacylase
MKMALVAVLSASLSVLCAATPAAAGEVFGGILAHEVNTPFTLKTGESGVDFQIGFRGAQIEALKTLGRPAPYIFASVNSAGDTSFVAAGLGWQIGKTVYVRPGIGLALHTGRIPQGTAGGRRVDLGSRLLFEPEISFGYRLSEKAAVELNWTHISNAQLLSGQNPGLDMIGVRARFKL